MTSTTEAPSHHATFHPLKVSDVERLTDDSVAVTFDVPEDLREAFAFTQGQHLTIRCDIGGEGVRRNYSICSPVGGPLRVGIKRIPEGAFSSWAMESLRPGDELEVMTPTGRFSAALDPTRSRHYALVAAGSGITPMISIAASVLQIEPGSRVTLLYGNRTSRSVMFLEELADLKNRHPERLQLMHFLSRESQDAELFHGRLDAERLRRVTELLLPVDTVDEWYLCGPFEMVTEAREALVETGADPAHVHLELFHTGALPRRRTEEAGRQEGTARVIATLDGRATVVDVARGAEPILDAVLRERADAPYACKGGVCGTCRAKVVSGRVDMDHNFALEPDEVARGYVLTCQSYPETDEVTVDYDG